VKAPIVEKETVYEAFEFVMTMLAQDEIDWPFTLKSTAPVGLPALPLPIPMMAVKVTDRPTTKRLREEIRLVVVRRLTVSSSKPDALGA
jgi:hypothetical protein